MAAAALAIAAVALVVALIAFARAGAALREVEEARRDARRVAGNAVDELRGEVERTRRLLAQVASGAPLTTEAILDGQLWRDVDAAEAVRLVQEEGVLVVDVRTPQETVTGIIAGARLIPMDELEERQHEIPRDRRVLVYCAGGGRSAAACEALSREGWDGLMNLTGGFGEWRGPVAHPGETS